MDKAETIAAMVKEHLFTEGYEIRKRARMPVGQFPKRTAKADDITITKREAAAIAVFMRINIPQDAPQSESEREWLDAMEAITRKIEDHFGFPVKYERRKIAGE
jgi:hypothetical protein